MKYLIFKIEDGAEAEDGAKKYAEFLLTTANNDEMFTGDPSPLQEDFFIGSLDELNASPDAP